MIDADLEYDLPEWLRPVPQPTAEQIEKAWNTFLALDLSGRVIKYSCPGGDEWIVRATVVATRSTPDLVIITVKDAKASPEARPGVKEHWRSFRLTEFHLDRHGDPPKPERYPIVLPPATATAPVEFPIPTSLAIGFIFEERRMD